MPRLSSYTPSIFAFLLGCLFMAYPILAAILVSGALFSFALFYATMITKLTQLQRDAKESFESQPNFRKVTFQMFEKGGTWFRHPQGPS